MKPRAFIRDWSYEIWGDGELVLVGTVYGHPRLPNGAFIHTSAVEKLIVNRHIAVTRNTIYTLGRKLTAKTEVI